MSFRLWLVVLIVAMVGILVMLPLFAFAAYTPLITSADFTGIQTDVSTAVSGIITISLIILGATILLKSFR